MIQIIDLKEANCKNCYKCIRHCPVKAIEFKNGQARIMSGGCIYCGNCLLVCPQNAKYISGSAAKVKNAIGAGEKVYASVDPSYISMFPEARGTRFSAALKKLGFVYVEESSVGAAQVLREYEKLIEQKAPNIITSACPSVNLLIQRYYPGLLPYLAPVVTPPVAHARMIKQIFGARSKVVFIGPCVARKFECAEAENGGSIYAAMTFDELSSWMERENVTFDDEDDGARAVSNPLIRYYPVAGGIIRNIPRDLRHRYEYLEVDGADRCNEVLDSIVQNGLTGYFLEMSACSGGCLGGLSLRLKRVPYLVAKNTLVKNIRRVSGAQPSLTEGAKANFTRSFKKLELKKKEISEDKIQEVLHSMGKTSPQKELNCGCCGYDTCREKAVAVIQGKADIRMCVPYMRELAESMSSVVVEHNPSGVIILDEKLRVEHINPTAAKMFGVKGDLHGHSISGLLQCDDFYEVLTTGKAVINHKIKYSEYSVVVEQSVVMVKEYNMMFIMLRDVTNQEKSHDERRKMTDGTVEFAQQVVERQVKAVQEIARLLGETTAETNLALSKLTAAMSEEKGLENDARI